MSADTPGGPAAVKAMLEQMSREERERLVRALAAVLIDGIRERERVEKGRRIGG